MVDDLKLRMAIAKSVRMKKLIEEVRTTPMATERISSLLYQAKSYSTELVEELDNLWKESVQ